MKTLTVREIVDFYHDRHSDFAPAVSLVHLRELLREHDEAIKAVAEWKAEAERLAAVVAARDAAERAIVSTKFTAPSEARLPA